MITLLQVATYWEGIYLLIFGPVTTQQHFLSAVYGETIEKVFSQLKRHWRGKVPHFVVLVEYMLKSDEYFRPVII